MSSEKDTPNTEDPVLEKSPSRWFVNPRVVEVPADANLMAISADTLPQENV